MFSRLCNFTVEYLCGGTNSFEKDLKKVDPSQSDCLLIDLVTLLPQLLISLYCIFLSFKLIQRLAQCLSEQPVDIEFQSKNRSAFALLFLILTPITAFTITYISSHDLKYNLCLISKMVVQE